MISLRELSRVSRKGITNAVRLTKDTAHFFQPHYICMKKNNTMKRDTLKSHHDTRVTINISTAHRWNWLLRKMTSRWVSEEQ